MDYKLSSEIMKCKSASKETICNILSLDGSRVDLLTEVSVNDDLGIRSYYKHIVVL